MEDAVHHRAFHQSHHRGPHDGLGVDAGVAHPGDVVEVEAAQPLHHEHPAGHERRMRAGHDVAGLAEIVEHRSDVDHVRGFHPEVEFFHDGLGEQFHQRGRVGQRGDRDAPDEERGEPGHDPQVLADEPGHGGALHLDDDLFAGEQRGRMHLGDGRGGERRLVEAREHVVDAGAEVALDHLADHVERLGGHLIATQLEFVDQLGGEQPFPAGDDLAELDVGRAEAFGGASQPLGDVGPARLDRGEPAATPADHPRQQCPTEASHHGQDAQPGRDARRLGQLRHLRTSRVAQSPGQRVPADPVRVRVDGREHPRSGVGERTPLTIGCPAHPLMLAASPPR